MKYCVFLLQWPFFPIENSTKKNGVFDGNSQYVTESSPLFVPEVIQSAEDARARGFEPVTKIMIFKGRIIIFF